jgi:hypothetical protein
MQGALDGAAGELQIVGNRFYRGPAVRSFACPITKIYINSPRPMGKFIGRGSINMVEVAHGNLLSILSISWCSINKTVTETGIC